VTDERTLLWPMTLRTDAFLTCWFWCHALMLAW
jgi:hypothetical protein